MRCSVSRNSFVATRRLLIGIAAAVAFGMTVASPAPRAAAKEDPPAEVAPGHNDLGAVDWGPNANGWNLTIVNNTPWDFSLRTPFVTDNVYYAPAHIPQNAADTILGRASVFGGPANMNVNYDASRMPVFVHIQSNFSGDVEASCATYSTWLRCDVESAVSNQPVRMVVSPALPVGVRPAIETSNPVEAGATALAVTESGPPRYVRGTDNRMHIEYDLLITNWLASSVTLTSIDVEDQNGETLLKMDSAAIANHSRLLSKGPPAPASIPPSSAIATTIDVPVASTVLPTSLANRVRYDLAADMDPSFRALLGNNLEVTSAVRVANREAQVITAPLTGDGWWNLNGCCQPSLHRYLLYPVDGSWLKSEMFAIDWVQVRDGSPFQGDGSQNEQWYGFGAPILAVGDGTVVAAVDGKPDQKPEEELGIKTPADFAGNYVILQIGPQTYAQFAHLQQGSVQVKVGDQLRAGQQIGRLGSSGESTAPHLHFGLLDGPASTTSHSLPFVIDRFTYTSSMDPDEGPGSLTGTPATLHAAYPLLHSIVNFGAN
jgi:hypothetical protein